MFDIITIGDSTLDTFLVIDDATIQCDLQKENCRLCLNYADKIPINNTNQSVGGNAANVAVGCKKLGLKSAIVTELGDDINGFVIKHELESAGVDTKMLKILPGKQTRYSVVLNYKSERTILSYHSQRNYTLPRLSQTKWIYYTSLSQSFEKIQKKLIGHLKKNPDIKLAMNPGSYQIKTGLAKIKQIIPRLEVLLVNKQEAIKLVGKNLAIKSLLNSLSKQGAKIIVITDSTNGSYATDGQNNYFMPASPIKAIAKTGAGDAYTSGFLSAIISGKTIPEAMQWGTANAGGVIQEFGAQKGLLNTKQLSSIIKKYKTASTKI